MKYSLLETRGGQYSFTSPREGVLVLRHKRTDWKFIFRAWPPRAFSVSPSGEVRRERFDLSIAALECISRKMRSRQWKEFVETVAICRSSTWWTPEKVNQREWKRQVGYFAEDAIIHPRAASTVPFRELLANEAFYRKAARLPQRAVEGKNDAGQFLAAIPADVRRVIRGLPSPLKTRALVAADRWKTFRRRAAKDPLWAVLFLIYGPPQKRQHSWRDPRLLLSHKELCRPTREVLNTLLERVREVSTADLPELKVSRKGMRILRSVPPSQLGELMGGSGLLSLLDGIGGAYRRGLQSKVVRHCPRKHLSTNLLRIVGQGEEELLEIAHPQLLWEWSRLSRRYGRQGGPLRVVQEVEMYLRDISRMQRKLRNGGVSFPVRRCKTPSELREYHDFLAERLSLLEDELKRQPFKREVPFPGNEFITPLLTPADLVIEGEKMHHCVASYDDSVHEGMSWIYHVEVDGEHATLELEREGPGREWQLGQLRGPCNAPPSEELWAEVKRWLEMHKIPAPYLPVG